MSSEDDSYVTSGVCIARYCQFPIRFRCTGCKEIGYCSEKCQRVDWVEHTDECSAFDPFNYKKHGLFTTLEYAIDDMVEDSYEDDDLQVVGELIEQELLDLDSDEEPHAELHERAVNFIGTVESGPNMYQLIYEHPFGDGDPELLQLVEDRIEVLIKEHTNLKDQCIEVNIMHRDQLSKEIRDVEALYDEIAFHVEQGLECPDWLRDEGVELIGKRKKFRKKRKKRKRKKKVRKRKRKKKGRKKKRKGKKKKDKKKRKKKGKKDKKRGLSKDERSAKKKKRKAKDKGKNKKRKDKDKAKNKKRKENNRNKNKKDKDKRKKDRKKRDKKERGDRGEIASSRRRRDDDNAESSSSSRRRDDDDNESGGDNSSTFLKRQKEAARKRRERAEDRRERKEAAEDRKERLKEAKAATDEAQEQLRMAETERRLQAAQGEVQAQGTDTTDIGFLIDDLSKDVQRLIIMHPNLSMADLDALSKTNKGLKAAMGTRVFWEMILQIQFPDEDLNIFHEQTPPMKDPKWIFTVLRTEFDMAQGLNIFKSIKFVTYGASPNNSNAAKIYKFTGAARFGYIISRSNTNASYGGPYWGTLRRRLIPGEIVDIDDHGGVTTITLHANTEKNRKRMRSDILLYMYSLLRNGLSLYYEDKLNDTILRRGWIRSNIEQVQGNETTDIGFLIDGLSKDVQRMIIMHPNLSVADLDSLSKTNKGLKAAMGSEKFWKTMLQIQFPDEDLNIFYEQKLPMKDPKWIFIVLRAESDMGMMRFPAKRKLFTKHGELPSYRNTIEISKFKHLGRKGYAIVRPLRSSDRSDTYCHLEGFTKARNYPFSNIIKNSGIDNVGVFEYTDSTVRNYILIYMYSLLRYGLSLYYEDKLNDTILRRGWIRSNIEQVQGNETTDIGFLIDGLSKDVQRMIIMHPNLSVADLDALSKTNKGLKAAMGTEIFWKKMLQIQFPDEDIDDVFRERGGKNDSKWIFTVLRAESDMGFVPTTSKSARFVIYGASPNYRNTTQIYKFIDAEESRVGYIISRSKLHTNRQMPGGERLDFSKREVVDVDDHDHDDYVIYTLVAYTELRQQHLRLDILVYMYDLLRFGLSLYYEDRLNEKNTISDTKRVKMDPRLRRGWIRSNVENVSDIYLY